MPKRDEQPPGLAPFTFHGLDLRPGVGDAQAIGDCFFCGTEQKFYVGMETGLWHCKHCDASGNPVEWLRRLWEAFGFPEGPATSLASERRLRALQTLESWGVRWSRLTEEWVIPFYNSQGLLSQLCRYAEVGPRMMLLPTPGKALGIHDGLAGVLCEDLGAAASTIYLCEKPWDAMCLWETLSEEDQQEPVSVLSLRTCSTWHESLSPLLAGKKVILCFDNDHPRIDHTDPQKQRLVPAQVHTHQRKIVGSLAGQKSPPTEIQYLRWSEEEHGHDPDLPSGYDLRDWLPKFGDNGDATHFTDDPGTRQSNLEGVLVRIVPVPTAWLEQGKLDAAAKKGQAEIKPRKCEAWAELIAAFKDALYWMDGLDRGLSVLLASVVSVDMPGDQLWIKMVSPPSGGKSTLCEALSVARKYTIARSTIKGFYSGYQSDKEGKEDVSLVNLINGKTLITKDGDTILQAPNRDQILSQARDLYDGNFRTTYLNKMSREYSNHRCTWVLAGTDALAIIDSSELGERFLTVRLMDKIDEGMEDDIGKRAIRSVINNKGMDATRGEGQYAPDLKKAMALTGGYIEYLRANALKLRSRIVISQRVEDEVHTLGKFVAIMRARPSVRHDEKTEREMATRLRIQLIKLAVCLPVVLQLPKADQEVMRRVRLTALDTARGRTLDITRHLLHAGRKNGMSTEEISDALRAQKQDKVYMFMRFLYAHDVVEQFSPQIAPGVKGKPKWRITEKMRDMYRKVDREQASG